MNYSKRVKTEILDKGLELYKQDPAKLNHHALAKALDVSNAKIHYHYGSDLKDRVLEHGVEKGDSHLIVQLYSTGSELVKHLTNEQIIEHKEAGFKSI